MRALITGINGFVGGYLAEQLLTSGGWEVWGLDRQPEVVLPQLRERVQFVSADLGFQEQVLSILDQIKPDVIFHLAAQSNVPQSFKDPADTLFTNILAQLTIFQAVLLLHQDPLVVVACSNEIYGLVRPDELPVNEDTPLRPVNPYAVSKSTQDLLAYQYYASNHLRTVRLRLFNHIGPRQNELFVASAFAAQIARIEAGLQEPLLRVGNLTAERDFTDVRDIVRAYELAALQAEVGLAYNVGSGRYVSMRWLLDTLLGFSTCTIGVEPDPSRIRPVDVPRVVCDNRRFRARTSWEPLIPLEQTLCDILEYWRPRVRAHDQ